MQPGPARVVASLGLLWLADALVLLLCAAAAVDTVRLLRDPSGDPESLVGSLLLTVGLVGLLLAGIEVTRAALAATTLRHTHRTRAPWAVRIAALLVGAGGSAAQAAPALSATVITAPANPGAATGGASLESTSAVPRVECPAPNWARSSMNAFSKTTTASTAAIPTVTTTGRCPPISPDSPTHNPEQRPHRGRFAIHFLENPHGTRN